METTLSAISQDDERHVSNFLTATKRELLVIGDVTRQLEHVRWSRCRTSVEHASSVHVVALEPERVGALQLEETSPHQKNETKH